MRVRAGGSGGETLTTFHLMEAGKLVLALSLELDLAETDFIAEETKTLSLNSFLQGEKFSRQVRVYMPRAGGRVWLFQRHLESTGWAFSPMQTTSYPASGGAVAPGSRPWRWELPQRKL